MTQSVIDAKRCSDNSSEKTQRRAYTVNEFCVAFRLSRATAFRLISTGRLRSVRIMGRRLIPADAAEALLLQEAS